MDSHNTTPEECRNKGECPVHGRVDDRPGFKYGWSTREVNYHGKYAVVTVDAPGYVSAYLAAAMGLSTTEPDRFTTLVMEVGEDGNLYDASEDAVFDQNMKFRQDHTPNLQEYLEMEDADIDADIHKRMNDAHELVLSMVKEGVVPA